MSEKYKSFQEEASKVKETMADRQKETKIFLPESKLFDTKNNTLLLRLSKDSIDLSDIKEIAEQKVMMKKVNFISLF